VIHQVEPDTSGPYGDQVRHALALFRTGNTDEAADAWRVIVARPAADAITLADAGGVFLLLYERRGDRHHLDEALTLLHRATEIAPASSAAAAVAASYLGAGYCLRFDADHDDADLQAALESCGQSLELSAPDDWRAPIYAGNLGAASAGCRPAGGGR
jgi:tetratricopeptide (TPR) repeat protein